jgi:dTDP-4-amino-4,6-dideoxygalactose transaminase
VVDAGFKYNMMDLQAAIGIHQLERVKRSWERRQEIWIHYMEALSDLPLSLPAMAEPGTRHAYHLFTILIDRSQCGLERDDVLNGMSRENIGVGVHYLSIPEHPFYRDAFGWCSEDYPTATRIGRQTISIPLSPELSAGDVGDVIEALRSMVTRNNGRAT